MFKNDLRIIFDIKLKKHFITILNLIRTYKQMFNNVLELDLISNDKTNIFQGFDDVCAGLVKQNTNLQSTVIIANSFGGSLVFYYFS